MKSWGGDANRGPIGDPGGRTGSGPALRSVNPRESAGGSLPGEVAEANLGAGPRGGSSRGPSAAPAVGIVGAGPVGTALGRGHRPRRLACCRGVQPRPGPAGDVPQPRTGRPALRRAGGDPGRSRAGHCGGARRRDSGCGRVHAPVRRSGPRPYERPARLGSPPAGARRRAATSGPSIRSSRSPRTWSDRSRPSRARRSRSRATTKSSGCWRTSPKRSGECRFACRREPSRPTTPRPSWPPAGLSPCSTPLSLWARRRASTSEARWRSTAGSWSRPWPTPGPIGVDAALTGPITRGDVGTVRAHLEALGRLAPGVVDLYLAGARRELRIAEERRALSPEQVARVRAALAKDV